MSGGRRRGLVWSLPVARSDVLGKLGPAFGIGAGCGVGVGFGLVGGICGLYERKIRNINPMIRNLTYDISDLYNFIDGLTDISALVYDDSLHAFLPYDRQWIKQKLFQHLKRLAHQ